MKRKWLTRFACNLFFLCLPLASAGCRAILPNPDQIIWTAKSLSPDGKFLALAKTVNVDGPGINAQWTSVSVEQPTSPDRRMEILTLDEDSTSVKNLKMNWLSPSHLEITYEGDPKVLFEAVKCFALDITVHNLPSTAR